MRIGVAAPSSQIRIGVAGRKYGLHVPKKKLKKSHSIFSIDDDDTTSTYPTMSSISSRRKSKKIQKARAEALAEDPTVFDYDGVYDDIVADRKEKFISKKREKKIRKSRYIGKLVNKAKFRERELNIIDERFRLKERQKEDHLYAAKEKFMTTAYKEKLEEDRKWLEEESKRAKDDDDDVTKKEDLSGFYINYMHGALHGRQVIKQKQNTLHNSNVDNRTKKKHMERDIGTNHERIQNSNDKKDTGKKYESEKYGSERHQKQHQNRNRDRNKYHDKKRNRKRDRTRGHEEEYDEEMNSNQDNYNRKTDDDQGINCAAIQKKYNSADRDRKYQKTEISPEIQEIQYHKKEEQKKEKMQQKQNPHLRKDAKAIMSARERYLMRKKQKKSNIQS